MTELVAKNKKIYKIMYIFIAVYAVFSITNIILNFFMLNGFESIVDIEKLDKNEELFGLIFK